MNIPIEIVVLVPVGVGSLAVIVISLITNKLNKHIDEYKTWQVSIYDKFDKHEDKLVVAIEKLGDKVTPIDHCDAKQREWQLRFDSMMNLNEQQHQTLIDSLTQMVSEMQEMRKCINLIQSDEGSKC